jgi:hypothetical protein
MELIKLNLGRSCLKYIIRAYNIKEIHVPYYCCNTVWNAIVQENCRIKFYHIDEIFMPLKEFDKNDYILYINYFGLHEQNCQKLAQKYPNLIVIKSISKSYGIPGVRLGVLASSNTELINKIRNLMSVWNINSYGEYIRPIALHGKSISLFSYPTDYDTEELRSKVLFSNNHLILETEENTSKFQLSLGDNIGSSNTLIHLKGYDDTNIDDNEQQIKGSQINIATDLYTNIGIFNPSNKIIEYMKNDEGKILRPI